MALIFKDLSKWEWMENMEKSLNSLIILCVEVPASFFLYSEGGMHILKKKTSDDTNIYPQQHPVLHFADGLCWDNRDCLLLHESFHCICEYICEWKAAGHFRKCCKFQDSKPVSGIDCLDYSTPLLSSCIWEYLLASFPCVTSKCLPVKKSGLNGNCNCPGPRDSEELLFLSLSWLPHLPFISLPMHLGSLLS